MEEFYHQPNFNEIKPKNGKKKVLFLVGLIALIYFAAGPFWQNLTGLLGYKVSVNPTKEEKDALDKNFPWPIQEPDRWDVLILGIRGNNDPDGGLLSDSIMLFSLDKKTGQSTLTSIPRDLYVDLPGMSKGKINEIYEKGVTRRKTAEFTEEAFSRLTGVYIDNLIVFDFQAFQEIVDNLGGIDLTLPKPFEEKSQWGYEFSLPAGLNHLSGQNALYYARSRYSTSDFDRSLRQQQIIFAVKEKAWQAGVLANPIKVASLLKSLNKNIVTDMNIFDTGRLIQLGNALNTESTKTTLRHLSTENILYQTFNNNIYVLRPKNDDWKTFRDYFNQIPNQAIVNK